MSCPKTGGFYANGVCSFALSLLLIEILKLECTFRGICEVEQSKLE